MKKFCVFFIVIAVISLTVASSFFGCIVYGKYKASKMVSHGDDGVIVIYDGFYFKDKNIGFCFKNKDVDEYIYFVFKYKITVNSCEIYCLWNPWMGAIYAGLV